MRFISIGNERTFVCTGLVVVFVVAPVAAIAWQRGSHEVIVGGPNPKSGGAVDRHHTSCSDKKKRVLFPNTRDGSTITTYSTPTTQPPLTTTHPTPHHTKQQQQAMEQQQQLLASRLGSAGLAGPGVVGDLGRLGSPTIGPLVQMRNEVGMLVAFHHKQWV